jgi:hypothetical protein
MRGHGSRFGEESQVASRQGPAEAYVRWLYSVASAQPDLALLVRVAGAVGVLEDRPADLESAVHDELALVLAAAPGKRQEAALAIARLRPDSPVLRAALRYPATRPAACAALACHLDDARVLGSYLELLSAADHGALMDALGGLSPLPERRPSPRARGSASRRRFPAALTVRMLELLDHADQPVVAAALQALEDWELSDDLLSRVTGLLAEGGAAVTTIAGQVLEDRRLPADLLAHFLDLLRHPDPAISASARLVLQDRELPQELLARAVSLLDQAGSAADYAASLLARQSLPRAVLARVIVLMEHPDSGVKRRALRILENNELPEGMLARIVRRLERSDPLTALSTLTALSSQDPGCLLEMLPRVISRISLGEPTVVAGVLGLVDGRYLPDAFLLHLTDLLGHQNPVIADHAGMILAGPATPDHLVPHVADRLDHADPSVVSRTLLTLQRRHLPAELLARVADLLQRADPSLTGQVLLLLEAQHLPDTVMASLIACLERKEPAMLSGARPVFRNRNLAEPLLQRIRLLLHDRDPAVAAIALQLLEDRQLPDDVLGDVVEFLSHPDPALMWAGLSALDGQPLPEALVVRGLILALESDEGPELVRRLLRQRPIPPGAVDALSSWLEEAADSRWQVAAELHWPDAAAAEFAVHVRAMAAAQAITETGAFDGLVMETAGRWLAAERSQAWAAAARALAAGHDDRGEQCTTGCG